MEMVPRTVSFSLENSGDIDKTNQMGICFSFGDLYTECSNAYDNLQAESRAEATEQLIRKHSEKNRKVQTSYETRASTVTTPHSRISTAMLRKAPSSALKSREASTTASSSTGRKRREAVPEPCVRLQSLFDEESGEQISNISRQCCDVLGEVMCYDCARIRQRFRADLTSFNQFPNIDESAKNLFIIPMIKRMFPEMSPTEIQQKLQNGEILQHKIEPGVSLIVKSFDNQVTDIHLDRKQRRFLRRAMVNKYKHLGTKIFKSIREDDLDLIQPRGLPRDLRRRNAIFPLPDYSSDESEIESVGTMASKSEVGSAEILPSNPEVEETSINVGQPDVPVLSMRWSHDYPRFYCGSDQPYAMPLWEPGDEAPGGPAAST